MNLSTYDHLLQLIPKEDILLDEPLSRHTTFRVGGNADALLQIQNPEQLAGVLSIFHKTNENYFILGNGSNVLVGDRGYHGTVLQISEKWNQIVVEGDRMRIQAGALLSAVARCAMEHALTGLEFASGIPGTIGGGIVMNAGAYGGEMKQVISCVTVMDQTGKMMTLDHDTLEFGYRTSVIKRNAYIVLEAELQLTQGNREKIKSTMEELAAKRREKQPLEYPSAGSTFKRPEGYFAGKLIMDTGLRGFRIGGAQVSEKHCGFVINTGNATAEDVIEVIQEVQERVRNKFGVTLETEVICLGEF